jgi:hypothetical protein
MVSYLAQIRKLKQTFITGALKGKKNKSEIEELTVTLQNY